MLPSAAALPLVGSRQWRQSPYAELGMPNVNSPVEKHVTVSIGLAISDELTDAKQLLGMMKNEASSGGGLLKAIKEGAKVK